MKQKFKWLSKMTENQIESILLSKYPNKECPICHRNGVYANSIETNHDLITGDKVLISFNISCNECGYHIKKWNNTANTFWMVKRQKKRL